jgi:hypothetical protein
MLGDMPIEVRVDRSSVPPTMANVRPKVKRRGIRDKKTLRVIIQMLPKFSFMNIRLSFILLVDDIAIIKNSDVVILC